MAKKGKFEGAVASFNFAQKKVSSGTKVSANLYPTLNIGTVKDKFVVDSKCEKLMEIGTGKRIIMIDNKVEETFTVRIGEEIVEKSARFLVTPGYEKDNKEQGAKLGNNSEYSYGVIWGAIIVNKDEVTEISPKDLEKLGLVIRRETEGGKISTIATQKISYTVAAVVNESGETVFATIDEDANGEPINVPVYALVDRISEDHEAKSAGKSTDESGEATTEA